MFVFELAHSGDHSWEDFLVEDGEVEACYVYDGEFWFGGCGGFFEYLLDH